MHKSVRHTTIHQTYMWGQSSSSHSQGGTTPFGQSPFGSISAPLFGTPVSPMAGPFGALTATGVAGAGQSAAAPIFGSQRFGQSSSPFMSAHPVVFSSSAAPLVSISATAPLQDVYLARDSANNSCAIPCLEPDAFLPFATLHASMPRANRVMTIFACTVLKSRKFHVLQTWAVQSATQDPADQLISAAGCSAATKCTTCAW